MSVVVAQGTFDLLHTGHLHYLREAASMGDTLVVIIARQSNVTHKPRPILPSRQRRALVAALDPVDQAILGDEEDIFVPIERLEPDCLVLGHDQHHEEARIREALDRRGIECRIERASKRDPEYPEEILSSNEIVDRILQERG